MSRASCTAWCADTLQLRAVQQLADVGNSTNGTNDLDGPDPLTLAADLELRQLGRGGYCRDLMALIEASVQI